MAKRKPHPRSHDVTRGRHGGNPRSTEANAATDKLRDLGRIVRLLHDNPAGLTCDEAEVELNLTHQTCSARFTDAKAKGWLVKCGERLTRQKCKADAFRLTRKVPSSETEQQT